MKYLTNDQFKDKIEAKTTELIQSDMNYAKDEIKALNQRKINLSDQLKQYRQKTPGLMEGIREEAQYIIEKDFTNKGFTIEKPRFKRS